MKRAAQHVGSKHVRYEHGVPLHCADCGSTSDLHLWFDVVDYRNQEVRCMHGLICGTCARRHGSTPVGTP